MNIRGLALTYGVDYDPSVRPQTGVGEMYYSVTYNAVIPIVALVLSAGTAVFYCLTERRRTTQEVRTDEKNYILCRRR